MRIIATQIVSLPMLEREELVSSTIRRKKIYSKEASQIDVANYYTPKDRHCTSLGTAEEQPN